MHELHEITVRMYAHYQALLSAYDESRVTITGNVTSDESAEAIAPLARAAAYVRAARDAGIVTGLPQDLVSGNPLDLPLTEDLYVQIVDIGIAVQRHIGATLRPVTQGEG